MASGKRITQAETIVQHVARQIAAGTFAFGGRLPSVRQMAWDHGVSKNTAAEAYDRLVAQGLVHARPGSGYFVNEPVSAEPFPGKPHVDAAVDIVSLLREQLDQFYELRPGDGRPPPSWMEGSELRRHFAGSRGSDAEEVDYGYGSSWGYVPLRERLRTMLMERSIKASLDGVLLTYGANHALDLIIRHMLEPGDVVFVDDPGYYPLFAKLTLARVTIVGIRRAMDGPDLDDLARKLGAYRPKLFFTQSQAHNPTGSALSPAVAFGLLQLASRMGFHVVEDDAFADMIPNALPRLAALDQLDRVLYVGTFSKTLSANLRCGFIAGKPSLVSALADLKMLTMVASSDYIERLIAHLINSGQYLRHLRRLRKRVDDAFARSIAALGDLGLQFEVPRAPGFYLWVFLPEGVDELALHAEAVAQGIFLAPGRVFHPDRLSTHPQAMRVNVAYGADPKFLALMRRHVAQNKNS
ncbi:PLP-dependent aminotransferase family protein [Pseudochelatococcus contaminans]|uniref:DNA-binding transcriptional MocR family regulator n=1 Tax=Pseudochelatococcus contaminans TaxID=1538103 RepID=A0A7W6EGV3_9HYPH|nr:PLP-dependent aminotransferase family protein [Pseudochelatococcus contaminans]MBB3809719.1 DNA-binding transcriptional MocR family regulator [Pseudochelatococcus contaminans]